MQVALKLLAVVLQKRLLLSLEASGKLCKEQAGFRTLEECVAQAMVCMDVLRCRRAKKQSTYVLFVDFKKAYDLVDHRALMKKVWGIGFRGYVYQFLQGLYSNSRLTVRTPMGLSGMIPLKRGVRQGCPASPTLFNIFINDLVRWVQGGGIACEGVSVPGLLAQPNGLNKLLCLLFADDLVMFSESEWALQHQMQRLEAWADMWGMKFGVKKCGIMVVTPDGTPGELDDPESLCLQGQPVPLVSEYLYLGVPIVANAVDLGLTAHLKRRVEKAQSVLMAYLPTLQNTGLPMHAKLRVVKNIIIPTISYAAELWGMNVKFSQPAQSLLTKCLKATIGSKLDSKLISARLLHHELGISSIYAISSMLRARAYWKYPRLRTWAAQFCRQFKGVQASSWGGLTKTWLASTRHGLTTLHLGQCRTRKEACQKLKDHLSDRGFVSNKALNANSWEYIYKQFKLDQTRGYLREMSRFPKACKGFHYLLKMRLGHFISVSQIVSWLPSHLRELCGQLQGKCALCRAINVEEPYHTLVQCPHWNQQRELYLGTMLNWIQHIQPPVSPLQTVVLFGGGTLPPTSEHTERHGNGVEINSDEPLEGLPELAFTADSMDSDLCHVFEDTVGSNDTTPWDVIQDVFIQPTAIPGEIRVPDWCSYPGRDKPEQPGALQVALYLQAVHDQRLGACFGLVQSYLWDHCCPDEPMPTFLVRQASST